MFLDGFSGEDKVQGKRRGKFGDGLQSGTAVLLRSDEVSIEISSNGHRWLFDWQSPSTWSGLVTQCLRITTKRSKARYGMFDCAVDTRIKISGLSCDVFSESQFLFLSPLSAQRTMSNFAGDILLGEEFSGSIYVKQMRVIEGDGKNKYGFNFHLLDMQSRDRINHLHEAHKLQHTFLIWHVELLKGNKEAAKLLIGCLGDSTSLEARAFRTHAISEAGATCLAGVFLALNPGTFPVLDTDYSGHAIITKKMKKETVNVKECLYNVLKISPSILSPQLAWDQLKEDLAKNSEEVEWTIEHFLAMTIVQQALCSEAVYCVDYGKEPSGADVKMSVHSSSRYEVSDVKPGGRAEAAGVFPGCELVRVSGFHDLPSWEPAKDALSSIP
ncbi:unnamed protein product [Polarella glacialis]|uniref:Uncharacterized protein n=1 Tax=Polarella glacialis TaxID=89957 RepID=A0A813EIU6_POLGL|nr:unnamed protein product [Polarella glacialis]